MSAKVLLAMAVLGIAAGAQAATVFCGDLASGAALKVSYDLNAQVVDYVIYQDGQATASAHLAPPSKGFHGSGSVSFSSSIEELKLEASSSVDYRVSKIDAIQLVIQKDEFGFKKPVLAELETLHVSGFSAPQAPQTHPELAGLECVL